MRSVDLVYPNSGKLLLPPQTASQRPRSICKGLKWARAATSARSWEQKCQFWRESAVLTKNHKEPQWHHNEGTWPVSQSGHKDLVDTPMFVLRSHGASEELAKHIMSRTLCDLGKRPQLVKICEMLWTCVKICKNDIEDYLRTTMRRGPELSQIAEGLALKFQWPPN
jgi:hypothetical protein